MDPRDKDKEDETEELIPDTEPSPDLSDFREDSLAEKFRRGDVVIEEDDGEYG